MGNPPIAGIQLVSSDFAEGADADDGDAADDEASADGASADGDDALGDASDGVASAEADEVLSSARAIDGRIVSASVNASAQARMAAMAIPRGLHVQNDFVFMLFSFFQHVQYASSSHYRLGGTKAKPLSHVTATCSKACCNSDPGSPVQRQGA